MIIKIHYTILFFQIHLLKIAVGAVLGRYLSKLENRCLFFGFRESIFLHNFFAQGNFIVLFIKSFNS